MPLVNPVPAFDFTVIFMNASSSAVGGALSAVAGSVATAALTGAFAEVSGLNAELETEDYHEGGRNAGPHKFVKWGKYPNLVFKRGITPDTGLWDWCYQVLYGGDPVIRKNGLIVLTDRTADVPGLSGAGAIPGLTGMTRFPIAAWSFSNGVPEKLQGPALNAKGNEIAIETLEIAHEGLIRIGAAGIPGASGIVASIGI